MSKIKIKIIEVLSYQICTVLESDLKEKSRIQNFLKNIFVHTAHLKVFFFKSIKHPRPERSADLKYVPHLP